MHRKFDGFLEQKRKQSFFKHTLYHTALWISIKSITALVLPLFSTTQVGNAREGKATELWEMWF